MLYCILIMENTYGVANMEQYLQFRSKVIGLKHPATPSVQCRW